MEVKHITPNEDAIAIVNPYTMLAPARDYTHVKKIKQLPWYEDGFLIDPCDAKDMRNEQYLVLSHYIGELINNVLIHRLLMANGSWLMAQRQIFRIHSGSSACALSLAFCA